MNYFDNITDYPEARLPYTNAKDNMYISTLNTNHNKSVYFSNDYSSTLYNNINNTDLNNRNNYTHNHNYNYLYNNSFDRIEENITMTKENLNNALGMIKKSVMDELDDELFYTALINQAIDSEDKEIIMKIRDDEIKHNRILRDVYYSITGITLPQARNMNEIEAQTYIHNLKKALMGEITAAEKYRKILSAMPNKETMLKIFEILVDEQRHADKYNYLLTKNKILKLAPPA